MKWLVQAVFIWCFANLASGGVLKCGPDSQDAPCTGQQQDLVAEPPVQVPDSAKEDKNAECQAGSEWESNCHYCRCSDDGVAECLKQDTCIAEYGDPILCKPNTTFLRGCNTCVCLETGLGLCTVETCTRSAANKTELPQGRSCLPDTFWKSKCNDCGCSPEGEAYCTKKACPGLDTEPDMECAPGTVWKNDCNNCHCSSDGHTLCTLIECEISSFNNVPTTSRIGNLEDFKSDNGTVISRGVRQVGAKEVSSKPKNCQPGKEFRLDCNKCLCDTEGIYFSCTRIDCSAPNAFPGPAPFDDATTRTKREAAREVPSECSPGSVFDQDCNVCRCTEDGKHAMCTMNRCPKPQDKTKPQESEGSAPATESTFRCNPGESYKRECNDCSCAADGQSIFCTLRYCD